MQLVMAKESFMIMLHRVVVVLNVDNIPASWIQCGQCVVTLNDQLDILMAGLWRYFLMLEIWLPFLLANNWLIILLLFDW